MTDEAGLVPHSPQWLAYWPERTDKIIGGGDEGRSGQIPLEAWDAIMEQADD
jgi:hypothetical protein